MWSNRISPFVTRSGVAPGRSTRSCGRAIVSIPSCTAPTFSKMPIEVHMIHPAMVAMRMARPLENVIAPGDARHHGEEHEDEGDDPADQRQGQPPICLREEE